MTNQFNNPKTHIDEEKGLKIPDEIAQTDEQVIFRTPRATIQSHSFPTDNKPYYGLIDKTHFGSADSFRDPKNAKLAPNKVSIKIAGEEPEIYIVENIPISED